MRLLLIVVLLVNSTASFAQVLKYASESIASFATRIRPDSTELAHPPLVTRLLDTTDNSIVAFYRKTVIEAKQRDTYIDHSQYDILIGKLFVPTENGNYQQILIDTLQPEGGDPEILAVFFANADKDKAKELLILCKYLQRHYEVDGELYSTLVYDYSNQRFRYLEKISNKFAGCDCGYRDGRSTNARYKTVRAVRAALQRMGYEQ